jgi:hypothetical protein
MEIRSTRGVKSLSTLMAASPSRWIVYCFADAEHAEKFRMRFGGERFNPKHRGRGSNSARWYKDGR